MAKTYAQGRRDERAAIVRAMRPREVVRAVFKFQELEINGRHFSGHGTIVVYEDVVMGGFSGRVKIPGLISWRVKVRPRGVTVEDREFMLAAMTLPFKLVWPNYASGPAVLISMPAKGPHYWRFDGVGELKLARTRESHVELSTSASSISSSKSR